jgi:hypothetical protein
MFLAVCDAARFMAQGQAGGVREMPSRISFGMMWLKPDQSHMHPRAAIATFVNKGVTHDKKI